VGGGLPVNDGGGDAVVFKLDPSGNLAVLHTFTGGADAGIATNSLNSTPVLDNAGNLYGATNGGGTSGNGVVFKIDPKGNQSVLYNLGDDPYGFSPYLLRDNAGDLYGPSTKAVNQEGRIFRKAAGSFSRSTREAMRQ
jgi:uncharacterized repeat protein (TIGR03803 family)